MAFEDFALARIVHKIFMRKNRAFRVAGRARSVNYDARIVFVEVGGEFGSVRADFIAKRRNVMLNDVNRLLKSQRLVSQQVFDARIFQNVSSFARAQLKIYRDVERAQ